MILCDCVITPGQQEHTEVHAVSHSRGHASCLLQVQLQAFSNQRPTLPRCGRQTPSFPRRPPLLTSRLIISPLHPLVCSSLIFLPVSSPSLALYFHVEQSPRCAVPCERAQAHPCIRCAVRDEALDHIRGPRWWKKSSEMPEQRRLFESRHP